MAMLLLLMDWIMAEGKMVVDRLLMTKIVGTAAGMSTFVILLSIH